MQVGLPYRTLPSETRFLDCLKAVAKRAELKPLDFWLHKFRATFATKHPREGIDRRTVQDWMAHKDLESNVRLSETRSQQGHPGASQRDVREVRERG